MIIPTPEKPKKRAHTMSESAIQVACVQWLWNNHEETRGLYVAIPNENSRSVYESKRQQLISGSMRKNMGILAGCADTALFMQRGGFGALFIEFKTDIGRQSDAQNLFQQNVEAQGYKYIVVRSLEDFKQEIEKYLDL